VISITPFDEEERFDEDGLREHFRRLAASGIGAYVAGAGSGEAYTLSSAESSRVIEIAVEELKGKVPVRAMGVEPRTAKQMIEFAQTASSLGVDAVQLYSLDMGHGNAPRTDELEAYYNDILSVVDAPVVVSTHQSVGYYIPVELLGRLTERFPQVIGINCTSPDITYLENLLQQVDERIEVHVGGPMQALTALALGASGYLSSDANVAPRLCVSLIDHYRTGQVVAAHEDFDRLIQLFTLLMHHGGIRAAKAALSLLGLPGGIPRRPRLPMTGADELRHLASGLEVLQIAATECSAE
jgi:4-hydroxy-tetrahydrodipicolinate synthase